MNDEKEIILLHDTYYEIDKKLIPLIFKINNNMMITRNIDIENEKVKIVFEYFNFLNINEKIKKFIIDNSVLSLPYYSNRNFTNIKFNIDEYDKYKNITEVWIFIKINLNLIDELLELFNKYM